MAPSAVEEPGIWTGSYLPVTLANLTVVAIAAFDGLALVAALPSIAEDLGTVALLPWVITAYLATAAVAVIMAGPVIDAIGVRRTFRATGLWFLLASAAAAAAPNMVLLVAARAAQGLGGGLVIAVALAAVGLAYPHHLRPRAFAANSIVWGTMGFGGPALAGALLAFGSWRLVFVVQLPLTAVALAVGWATLPSTRDRPSRIRTDWKGVGLLATLTLFSLLAVGEIGVRWWMVGLALTIAGLSAAAYWRHSGTAAEPVLARDHVTRFPLLWVHLTSGLVLIAGLAADNYLPLYVQVTRGRSVEFAAFSLVFLTVGWTIGSVVFSKLLSHRPEAEVIVGGAVLIVPAVAVAGASVALDWPLAAVFAGFALIGLSIGLVSTAGLTLLQSAADESEMGRVNAAHQFVRTLCITYGVALGGAILLLVVDLRVGDVEAVREVLAGEDVAIAAETTRAVGDGLAWVFALSATGSVVCLALALSLLRRSRRPATVAVS